MNEIKSKSSKSQKKLIYFVIFGSLLWGLIIIPLCLALFDNISISIETRILCLVFSFIATMVPFYFDFHKPSEGREYFILLYPIFTIPFLYIMLKVRQFLMK